MAASDVEHALVHVDVDDLGAVFDLFAGHGQGFLVLLLAIRRAKRLGAGDVGALPDVDESGVPSTVKGSRPARRQGLGRG
jgi:hypothetical protein